MIASDEAEQEAGLKERLCNQLQTVKVAPTGSTGGSATECVQIPAFACDLLLRDELAAATAWLLDQYPAAGAATPRNS